MTLPALKKLTARLREALAAKATGGALAALAQEYAQRCDEAAARLEQCCAMLEKGSGYQALQLAETEPALPEVIAALSFAERRAWVDFCRAQQLPVPSAFEVKKVQAMDAMYAQGITAAHPLYKDYRSAISLRDDEAALRIVRSITRLNPSDANAQSEQARLEEKRVREAATALKAALESGDESRAALLTAELETLATPQRLEAVPEFQTGRAVRQKLECARTVEFVRQTVESLTAERSAGDWQSASVALAQVDQACMEHGLAPPPDLVPALRELRTWTAENEARAAEEAAFRERLATAGALAEQIAGRLAAGGYAAAEAQAQLSALEQEWEAVARCNQPVPATEQQRVDAAAKALRYELERLRRRRRLTLAVTSAAAAAMLAVAGWAGWTHLSASRLAEQLQEMQTSRRVADADKLVQAISQDQASLTRWAGLEETMAAAQSWIKAERARLTAAEQSLQLIEAGAAKDFADTAAADLSRTLEEARSHHAALAAEFRESLAPRLAIAANAVDARLTAMRSTNVSGAAGQVARVEQLLAGLTPQSPLADIRAALSEMTPLLEQLQAGLSESAEATAKLPADLAVKAGQARMEADKLRKLVSAFASASAAVAGAATLEEFKAALELFRDLKLVEALPARSAALEIPVAADVLAALLYNEPSRRAALTARKGAITLRPAAVLKDDLTTLLAVRDDESLNDVYVVTLQTRTGPRTLYSSGKPRSADDGTEKPGAPKRYTGKFYDPKPGDTTPNFVTATIPGEDMAVTGFKLSPVSEFLKSLALENMTDAAGEHYTGELLLVFSRLAQTLTVPASVRAYLWDRFATILQRDPDGWGLGYCPSLQEDLQKLHALSKSGCGPYQWMLPGDEQKSAAAAACFKALQDRSYTAEAMAMTAMESKIISAGIRFAGYSGGNGELKLLPDAQAVEEFWLLDRVQKKCRLLKRGADGSLTAAAVPPFSPIFFVPADRRKLLAPFTRARHPGSGPYFTEP